MAVAPLKGRFKALATTYPLVWDLVGWAADMGVDWFDFGGVTEDGTGSDDPLGGISDFKRHFAQRPEEVAEDCDHPPIPVQHHNLSSSI
jgi:lipid II:glycine glycyltransferase (peptidoglycan interpeptide bridge formation enzyme)